MALFPKEQELQPDSFADAPERMRWTREQGTRRLVAVLITLVTIWYVVGKIQDHYLLSRHWSTLKPDIGGLTVVGTLDRRGDYDRNLLKVVTANKTSRVELTDFGWNSVFNSENGSIYGSRTEGAIKTALSVDDASGYAMLEPLLRGEINSLLGDRGSLARVTPDTVVTVYEGEKPEDQVNTSLGKLIKRYSGDSVEQSDTSEKDIKDFNNHGGREAEHGVTIPADSAARTCPVVLTGANFIYASLEEQPKSVFLSRSYTVHLGLSPEGRSRFFQWSHDHASENLVFVLNHHIAMAGRIRQTLDVNEWELRNIEDEQAARSIVDYVSSLNHNRI